VARVREIGGRRVPFLRWSFLRPPAGAVERTCAPRDAYLPDPQAILDRGWLHPGSRIVGDNIKFPGAPEFRAYLNERDGREWRVTEHETHVEYQSLLKDLVIEAEFLGPGG
jgi:hypothetical protein